MSPVDRPPAGVCPCNGTSNWSAGSAQPADGPHEPPAGLADTGHPISHDSDRSAQHLARRVQDLVKPIPSLNTVDNSRRLRLARADCHTPSWAASLGCWRESELRRSGLNQESPLLAGHIHEDAALRKSTITRKSPAEELLSPASRNFQKPTRILGHAPISSPGPRTAPRGRRHYSPDVAASTRGPPPAQLHYTSSSSSSARPSPFSPPPDPTSHLATRTGHLSSTYGAAVADADRTTNRCTSPRRVSVP